jgi:hypothetical protein
LSNHQYKIGLEYNWWMRFNDMRVREEWHLLKPRTTVIPAQAGQKREAR